MAENFYTILTNIGKAQIANASLLGEKVNFTYLALGDGNGNYYNPIETQTGLVNEVWRGQIGQILADEENPNWIVLETVISASVGGFTIREAGVFDVDGNLLAVGKYPETYKPVLADGSAKDLYIRMILEVLNTSVVTLKVDPTVILATKKDIEVLSNRVTKNENDILELKQGTTIIKDLQTEDKRIAGAINELKQKTDTHSAQMAELGQNVGDTTALTTTNKTDLVSAINEVNAKPTTNPDIGRYQAEFDWDGAELNHTNRTSNMIELEYPIDNVSNKQVINNATEAVFSTTWKAAYFVANAPATIELKATFYLHKIGSPPELKISIYNDNLGVPGTQIGSTTKRAAYTATTETLYTVTIPITELLVVGNKYYIVFNMVGGSSSNCYMISYQTGLTDGNHLSSSDSGENWGSAHDRSIWLQIGAPAVLGTATKTYTPSNLKKWGNVKWTQETPANTSVVCDVLDASDNVLKAGITAIADISDIDTTQYPLLNLRWTLLRNSTEDESPTVSAPSITWEGKSKTWEVIADVTLTSDTAQVDFENLGLENYKQLVLILNTISSTSSTGTGDLRFNDDSGTNYSKNGSSSGGISYALVSNTNGLYTRVIFEISNTDKYKIFDFKENRGTTGLSIASCKWSDNNKIRKINLVAVSGVHGIGSTFTLLGVK